jgi:coatomer protein complex subunit gamma
MESETEYIVQCIKHIFQNHIVLQFSVQNTIENQQLDNATVLVDDSDSKIFSASGEIACEGIKYGETKNSFTILECNADATLVPNHFTCELCFTMVQVDPTTGEEGDTFEEEYPLKDLEILTSDFMAKVAVPDFHKVWENSGNEMKYWRSLLCSSKRWMMLLPLSLTFWACSLVMVLALSKPWASHTCCICQESL